MAAGLVTGCRRLLADAGDLGGVRMTAIFLGSRVGGVCEEERPVGVPGDPGLLYPLLSPDLGDSLSGLAPLGGGFL